MSLARRPGLISARENMDQSSTNQLSKTFCDQPESKSTDDDFPDWYIEEFLEGEYVEDAEQSPPPTTRAPIVETICDLPF